MNVASTQKIKSNINEPIANRRDTLKFVEIFYLGLELTSDYIVDSIYGIVVF
jgi:hypothetical protein